MSSIDQNSNNSIENFEIPIEVYQDIPETQKVNAVRAHRLLLLANLQENITGQSNLHIWRLLLEEICAYKIAALRYFENDLKRNATFDPLQQPDALLTPHYFAEFAGIANENMEKLIRGEVAVHLDDIFDADRFRDNIITAAKYIYSIFTQPDYTPLRIGIMNDGLCASMTPYIALDGLEKGGWHCNQLPESDNYDYDVLKYFLSQIEDGFIDPDEVKITEESFPKVRVVGTTKKRVETTSVKANVITIPTGTMINQLPEFKNYITS